MSKILGSIGLDDIAGGINLIDLGASGTLSRYWRPLKKLINLYAFEPNKEECQRLAAASHSFASTTYIPIAVAGTSGAYTLYKTKNMFCWSLLEPNHPWLSRFAYHDLFTVEGTSTLHTTTLEEAEELKGINIDAIKCDTQGLELPILNSSPNIVNNCFIMEIETGFVENYRDETTFQQIAEFMRKNDFLLFDINTNHRISRNNRFSRDTLNQQILWCESTWMKDYIAIENKQGLNIDRTKALKSLMLCANHGCIDYGFELATLFHKKHLLSDKEFETLKNKKSWILADHSRIYRAASGSLSYLLGFIPKHYRDRFGNFLMQIPRKK